jgi:hypothetical protein
MDENKFPVTNKGDVVVAVGPWKDPTDDSLHIILSVTATGSVGCSVVMKTVEAVQMAEMLLYAVDAQAAEIKKRESSAKVGPVAVGSIEDDDGKVN